MIEHSYKADSDLSPAGWEYAERLKAAVSARRKAIQSEKKENGEQNQETNPLIVGPTSIVTMEDVQIANTDLGLDISEEKSIPHCLAIRSIGI